MISVFSLQKGLKFYLFGSNQGYFFYKSQYLPYRTQISSYLPASINSNNQYCISNHFELSETKFSMNAALLSQIQGGKGLKKVAAHEKNDRSEVKGAGAVAGSSNNNSHGKRE